MKRIKNTIIIVLLVISLVLPAFQICVKEAAAAVNIVTADEVEWNVSVLQADNSYDDSLTAAKIKVAVIDSGLDYDPDIPFVERKDFLGQPEDEINELYQDMSGHGTSVAGLICARKNDTRICGLSANVDLYAARVLDIYNEAPVSRVIEAVRWAMSKKVHIIHMSFGTTDDYEDLHQVIKEANAQGILIIAAAGNHGTAGEDESTVEYPAAYPEVLAVGATSPEGIKSDISSSGEELDVVAPGDKILTTGAFGGVSVDEGTSMAAAQVTGIAAALWGKNPNQSNEFIKGLLIGSANKNKVLKHCGNGMVDYQNAKSEYTTYENKFCTYKKMGFKDSIAAQAASNQLADNEKPIEKHTDVKYVTGSWGTKAHMDVVDKSNGVTMIKIGTCVNDHAGSTKHGDRHPCFHGYDNYIANYAYFLYLAHKYMALGEKTDELKKYPSTENVFGKRNPFEGKKGKHNIQSEVKRSMKKVFAGVVKGDFLYDSGGKLVDKENKESSNETRKQQFLTTYAKFIKKKGEKFHLTGEGKAYIVLGIALHSVADTFSHRAGKEIQTRTSYLQHGIDKTKIKDNWEPVAHNKATKEMLENGTADKNHISYEWAMAENAGERTSEKYKFDILYQELAVADNIKLIPELYNAACKTGKVALSQLKEKKSKKKSSVSCAKTLFKGAVASLIRNNKPIYKLDRLCEYYQEVYNGKVPKIFAKVNMNGMNKISDIKTSIKKKKITFSWKPGKNIEYIRVYAGKTKGGCKTLLANSEELHGKTKKVSYTVEDNFINKGYRYINVKCYRGGEVQKKPYKINKKRKVHYVVEEKKKSKTKKSTKTKTVKFPKAIKVKKSTKKNFSHWKTKNGTKYQAGDKIPFTSEKDITLYAVFKKKAKTTKKSTNKKSTAKKSTKKKTTKKKSTKKTTKKKAKKKK